LTFPPAIAAGGAGSELVRDRPRHVIVHPEAGIRIVSEGLAK
jgi:hypothetical protein